MNVVRTELPDVLILQPKVFHDTRGYFSESWNERVFRQATGVDVHFVQDNHAHSIGGVLRGVHYQIARPQGKLVRVVAGRVLDVAVDLRRSSPTFAQWVAVELSAENRRQLWVPPGFGHAYLTLSDHADVLYKATEYWAGDLDRTVHWNDPRLRVAWPLANGVIPVLSDKDAGAPMLDDAELYP